MIQRIFNILTIASLIFFAAVVILAAPSFFDPEIAVVNHSSGAVSVVARWRDTDKHLGTIEPQSSYRFGIDDEAAIVFEVGYANGRQIETEPLYFTSGVDVIADISDDGVEVRYAHETE